VDGEADFVSIYPNLSSDELTFRALTHCSKPRQHFTIFQEENCKQLQSAAQYQITGEWRVHVKICRRNRGEICQAVMNPEGTYVNKRVSQNLNGQELLDSPILAVLITRIRKSLVIGFSQLFFWHIYDFILYCIEPVSFICEKNVLTRPQFKQPTLYSPEKLSAYEGYT